MSPNDTKLEAFALQPLALQLACAPHCLGRLTGAPLGRFFVVPPELHLPENSLSLHLFLERFQRLVNVVVANEHLHLAAFSFSAVAVSPRQSGGHALYHGVNLEATWRF
jgi:hypothetical protein